MAFHPPLPERHSIGITQFSLFFGRLFFISYFETCAISFFSPADFSIAAEVVPHVP
jgi:hypothetical protein